MSLKKVPDGVRPPPIAGLRHVALRVADIERCEKFYVDLLAYRVEWRPDPDNVYLSCGVDNLALHRSDKPTHPGALDHIGIILRCADDVDLWHEFLKHHNVRIKTAPKTHRDGARSFYCYDPEGNLVQMIYHPPIAREWVADRHDQ